MTELPRESNSDKVQVPMRTAQEILWTRDHLREASRHLATASRTIRSYSSEFAVLADHIERQVGMLTDRVQDLTDGLEVIGLEIPK